MSAATEIRNSVTFQEVLKTLLHIGNAVEQREAGGFDLEFLERAESYKDACQKNLINHAACCVMDRCPGTTNLYSDFPNVHDAWRVFIYSNIVVSSIIVVLFLDGTGFRRAEVSDHEGTGELVSVQTQCRGSEAG